MLKKKVLFALGAFLVFFQAFKSNYNLMLRDELKSLVEANRTISDYQGLSFDLASLGPYILFKINNENKFLLEYLKITSNKNIFERTFSNEEIYSFLKSRLEINDKDTEMVVIVSFRSSTIIWILALSLVSSTILSVIFYLAGTLIDRNRKRDIYFLATQVAHDIRSPLEVLKRFEKNVINIDPIQRDTLRMSIWRINEIAESLLKTEKNLNQLPALINVANVLEELIREKQIEFGHISNVKIYLDIESNDLIAKLPSGFFNRIISNLINNAVDALESLGGEIQVELYSVDSWNVVSVRDSGVGIPDPYKTKVFQKGFTTKTNGNGLGLFGAKTELERHGGKIKFESESGSGTVFFIYLPKQIAAKAVNVALIDNDKLIRYDWENYAKERGIKFNSFPSVESFLDANIQCDVSLFIDSDLGENIKGEVIAKDLFARGYKSIYLATGYSDIDLTKYPWIKGIHKKTPSF